MISQPWQNSSEAPVNCVSGLALETSLTTLKSQKNRQICKMAKQADCNSVALGRCRFKSYSADYTPQSLNGGGVVWKTSGR